MKRLKKLFVSHQPQFLFLLILFMVLNFLSVWPYFNLVLSQAFILAILWLVSIFLFKLSGRFSIKVALILFCFCPFLLILKQEKSIEEIGNLVYGLLLVGAIQEFVVIFFRRPLWPTGRGDKGVKKRVS